MRIIFAVIDLLSIKMVSAGGPTGRSEILFFAIECGVFIVNIPIGQGKEAFSCLLCLLHSVKIDVDVLRKFLR